MCVLVAGSLFGGIISAQENTNGIGVQAALESIPSGEKPPKRFALIVAAGDYDDTRIPDLPPCTQDGKVIKELLCNPEQGMFSVENVVLLTGPDVTMERVIGELEDLATRIGKDDLVVVYFSGHGATDARSRAYSVMQNTNLLSLRATALPELDVIELLDGLPTSRLLVLIDACDSAATANLSTKAIVDPARLYPKFDGNGRVAITASNSQQLSLVIDDPRHPGNGHSVFNGS